MKRLKYVFYDNREDDINGADDVKAEDGVKTEDSAKTKGDEITDNVGYSYIGY